MGLGDPAPIGLPGLGSAPAVAMLYFHSRWETDPTGGWTFMKGG